MKVIRNATLQFGLVNVPVGLASTASEQKVSFRLLHRECKTPVKQMLHCPSCDKTVVSEEIVKGFEYEKNSFFEIEEDELAQLSAERDSIIAVSKFVPRDNLDPLLVKSTYYLLPSKLLAKSYEVLELAIVKTGLIAIGSSSLWGKESPCAISSEGGIMRLHLLWCADEIISAVGAGDNLGGNVKPEELSLAEDVLRAMASTLEPQDLISKSRERIHGFLTESLSGERVKLEKRNEQALEASIDLMGALKDSVAAVRKAKPKPRARPKVAAKK